jgi:RNA polymerase sigma factor (sigma-70 family)
MTPAGAAALVRAWFAAHSSTIERALAWYGVRSVEDRADLTQEVLMAGYVALLRGEIIDSPRAWLRECARKYASNYRHKALRRMLAGAEEVVNAMPTPEQIVEHRELLRRLFDCIDDEAQGIIFDLRIDNLSWEEIARERQISVDQARYLFRCALAQMEEALAKDDSTGKARPAFVLAIAMDHVFAAVRAEADDVPAAMRQRVWESLERSMDAVGTSAADPEPTPINSTPVTPMSAGAIAGMVGGGVVLGIILGYLIHGGLSERSQTAPGRAGATPVLAISGAANGPGDLHASAQLVQLTSTAEALEASPVPSPPRDGRALAASRSTALSMVAPTMLLERARTSFRLGDVRAALAFLGQHERLSPRGLDAEDRWRLLREVCAAPEARDASECVAAKAASALE